MKVSKRTWRLLGAGVLGLILLGLAVRFWIVPAIIRGQLQARYGGLVQIRGWWLGGTSAGVRNLALGEGPESDSPIWARAEKVETDLSIGKLLRGRFLPDRITLERPVIAFRIGEDGKPLTRPPLKGGGGGSVTLPEIVVHNGQITLAQEGRPPMIVRPVMARIASTDEGEMLSGSTVDPTWGHWSVVGKFNSGFSEGTIHLASDGPVAVTKNKTARIPFVPKLVWEQVDPQGPVSIALDLATGAKPGVVTSCVFEGVTLRLPGLGLVAEGATGTMTVDGGLVKLAGMKGAAIGGSVAADGTLDFTKAPPKFDLTLKLDGVDVARTPPSWQLAEGGLTGKLTGEVRLIVALTEAGADLTGSGGDAVIENGTLGGVPVKSLKIAMKAEGDSLQYETGDAKTTGASLSPLSNPLHGFGNWLRLVRMAPAFVAFQSPPPSDPPPKKPGGFVLPKTLSTEVEFSDVDLVQVLSRVQALGIPLPFPVAGKLSLKAKATIPLGSLKDVKLYAFHGNATLTGASIDGVDLGELRAKVDLEDGVLDLTEFRGRLVDRPAGSHIDPPRATEPVASEGALPTGGFRGLLHAELSPPGRLQAHFEGNTLPIGELAAPALPRPTPLSGAVSFRFDAGVDVAHLDDPASWTLLGKAEAARIAYRGTTLDRVGTSLTLQDGRLALPDFSAALGRQPLKANLGLNVRAPYDFQAELDVTGWDLDSALAFVPAMPRPAPIGGKLSLVTKARGTLDPLSWTIDGDGTVGAFRAGAIAFGDLPVKWRTEGDVLRVAIVETRPDGGTIHAEALIPTRGAAPITGSATLRKIDVAAASGLAGGIPPMSGKVDGQGTFLVRPSPGPGEAAVEGNLTISAPDLVVRDVPTRNLQAMFRTKDGSLVCDFYAEGMGGKMELAGNVPLTTTTAKAEVNGSLKAVGFELGDLWKVLGLGGAIAEVRGRGAIDANLRSHLADPDLRVRGVAEFRDLKWGADFPIGTLKGNVTLAPETYRVDELAGDILGGRATGSVVAERPEGGPQRMNFNLDVEHASLKRTLAFLPILADRIDGTGNLKVTGVAGGAVRASGEVAVPEAQLYGLPLRHLRGPAELEFAPNGGTGALKVRRWNARFAGGRLEGDARFGLGHDHSFSTETHLTAIDVENLARVFTSSRRPASGKVSGKISVNGSNPSRLESYRGRITLDLEAASLFELPVFREFERFLGSANGGTFDNGDLVAAIVNRQIVIESLTLEGRLVQLHATGTVGFDQKLDLEVLINTNEIIGQTGQSLVALIPGLSNAIGRGGAGVARVGNYLQNRLLKFRVTGTIGSPSVNIDPAVAVTEGAVGFFSGVFKLPLNLIR